MVFLQRGRKESDSGLKQKIQRNYFQSAAEVVITSHTNCVSIQWFVFGYDNYNNLFCLLSGYGSLYWTCDCLFFYFVLLTWSGWILFLARGIYYAWLFNQEWFSYYFLNVMDITKFWLIKFCCCTTSLATPWFGYKKLLHLQCIMNAI
jgi:hypothetical protein